MISYQSLLLSTIVLNDIYMKTEREKKYKASSVNYRLSPTFHSNGISLRAIILQTSGFHQSIT